MPAETQKLIAYGKVMDDDTKTVGDYKIAENGFIVVMTVKVSQKFQATKQIQHFSFVLNSVLDCK